MPAECRFQVSIAHPVAPIRHFVHADDQNRVEPALEDAFAREIGKITDAIPAGDLAIQWDIASAVFEALERGEPTRFGNTKTEMYDAFAARIVRLADAVPEEADLLLPFLATGIPATGTRSNRRTCPDMVEMANRVSAGVARTIDLIHMPVPRDRDDRAYFEPLKALNVNPETKLSIGLVHHTDGVAGTRRRLDVAPRLRRRLSDRDRMRVRPAPGRNHPRTSGDPRGSRGHGLTGTIPRPTDPCLPPQPLQDLFVVRVFGRQDAVADEEIDIHQVAVELEVKRGVDDLHHVRSPAADGTPRSRRRRSPA